ncbi:MAG: GatB/YqeY domain-containing protein, partial [Crocinitomicaceae bacterium]|nr:GatB/YqeY domain-containing protein [Crocinitomicaceae bacterium]
MAFSDEINQAIKDAMRAKDKVRLSTLRDIKSKIMVEATSGSGNAIDDGVVLKICMKLFKQR